MDYLEALADEVATTMLDGEEFTVRRAHLGEWYRLQSLRAHVQNGSPVGLCGIVAIAIGRDAKWVEEHPSLAELLEAAAVVERINRPRGDLPYMHSPTSKGDGWEYDNRGLAYLVHKLASSYGWTPEYILEHVYPEEAFCYMQEILIDEHNDVKQQFLMNPLGDGKQKFPELPWPHRGREYKPVKVSRQLVEHAIVPHGAVSLAEMVMKRSD